MKITHWSFHNIRLQEDCIDIRQGKCDGCDAEGLWRTGAVETVKIEKVAVFDNSSGEYPEIQLCAKCLNKLVKELET